MVAYCCCHYLQLFELCCVVVRGCSRPQVRCGYMAASQICWLRLDLKWISLALSFFSCAKQLQKM
ncbi:mCG1036141 [Mus musculus]|nr:mCG1036141 [Mus musculus]